MNNQKVPHLPLFYSNPRPLQAQEHQNLALRKNFGFQFTQEVNAVPVNLIEMPQICHYYPIAFSPDGNATPVAILGLRDNENLFLEKNGYWLENAYIPAYIRRYPFIFSEMPGGDQLTLCIDYHDSIVEENGAQSFFEKNGKPSKLTENALEFCKSYHAAAQQTLEFSAFLSKMDVLVDREAQISIGRDKKINFSGFKIIDEKRLQQQDNSIFIELKERGFLPFIYAHLFSSSQWQYLSHLLKKRNQEDGNTISPATNQPYLPSLISDAFKSIE